MRSDDLLARQATIVTNGFGLLEVFLCDKLSVVGHAIVHFLNLFKHVLDVVNEIGLNVFVLFQHVQDVL